MSQNAEYERKGQSAKVVVRQILPTLRALWYGGTVILNAHIDRNTVVVGRDHSIIDHTVITGPRSGRRSTIRMRRPKLRAVRKGRPAIYVPGTVSLR